MMIPWDRWKNDYLKGLHERHDMKHKPSKNELTLREVSNVTIKYDKKNREKRKIGIVHQLFKWQGGFVRGVLLPPGKSQLERPIQYLYPLELNCDVNLVKSNTKIDETKLNIKAKEFRPKQNAAANAKLIIQEIIK